MCLYLIHSTWETKFGATFTVDDWGAHYWKAEDKIWFIAGTLKKHPVYITHSLTLYEDAFIIIILMRKGVLIPCSSSATPANTNDVISI